MPVCLNALELPIILPTQLFVLPTQEYGIKSKLDGVSPVDNRPSTDKLDHFVRKKKKKKYVTCDM